MFQGLQLPVKWTIRGFDLTSRNSRSLTPSSDAENFTKNASCAFHTGGHFLHRPERWKFSAS